VTEPSKKTRGLEVESQSLQDELIAIKDRLSAIETIASISNASVVKKYVEDHLLTDKGRDIMKACEEEPRTRSYLKTTFAFNSDQALNHHLKPLREADLLRQRVDNGTTVFEWSNLFRRLPKSTIRAILGKQSKL
jgi:DNA-binding transcriptional ArsR family regulator